MIKDTNNMEKRLIALLILFSSHLSFGQNFSGQWKGEFIDKSTNNGNFGGDNCQYVLELDANGPKVTGTSYTYFTENGKRFYTICKLEGFIKENQKYIEIKEVDRLKTNIPLNIPNCFQVHKLTYFKKGNEETLEGSWIPAPNQQGNCGYGNTSLSRRTLQNVYNNSNDKKKKKKNVASTDDKKLKAIKKSKAKTESNISAPSKENETTRNDSLTENRTQENDIPTISIDVPNELSKLEKRKNTVIKTIEVESNEIKVVLYDNGDVDGDSISVFYNGNLYLSNKKLSEKPINLTLKIDNQTPFNELIMYAENLGSIPPNTALMVVTDGPNRYEVRITSDLEKSGVIRFVKKGQTH